MKVIMRKDLKGVGQRDTIQEVHDGYALNFLIPQGFAVQASKEGMVAIEKKRSSDAAAQAAKHAQAAAAIKTAEGKRVVMTAKVNEHGHLFKGIHISEIAEAFSKQLGVSITEHMISGIEPVLRAAGEYPVTLEGGGAKSAAMLAIENAAH